MKQSHDDSKYKLNLCIGVIVLVAIICVVLLCKNYKSVDFDSSLKEGILSVNFLDEGKADAIVIRTKDSTILIDTGLKSKGKELVQFLQNNKIESIDYMILTHFDKDHVGGAAKVIENFKVNQIITSDYYKDSKEVDNYVKAYKKAQISPQTLNEVTQFTLDNVIYTVYPHIARSYPEQESNNTSLIISIQHGENKMLFTGDANNLRIQEFITKQEHNNNYQLLKVPYHGHYMEELPEFVRIIQPKYAVITSSDKKMEDTETMQLLQNANAKVFLTREGAVTVLSDGETLNVMQ